MKCMGYRGEISAVYTSDLEAEMNVALRIWERILGFTFRTCDRDYAKVELMYTGFWLDILDIKSSALIYEAAAKMILKGWLRLDEWFKIHKFGTGVNQNLGIIGYLPFLTSVGDSSLLTFDQVPNFKNFRTYQIPRDEALWYTANLLFPKKIVVENGPAAVPEEKASEMIRFDLTQYYCE